MQRAEAETTEPHIAPTTTLWKVIYKAITQRNTIISDPNTPQILRERLHDSVVSLRQDGTPTSSAGPVVTPQASKPQETKEIKPMATPQVKSPLLDLAEMKLQFGLMRKKRNRTMITINPLSLNCVITRMYNDMVFTLGEIFAPPVTQANFTRVIRTIIHKRVQDIVTYQTKIRPQNEIKVQRSFMVP